MPKFAKGSMEARSHMAHLRSLRRKKGGSEPATPISPPPSPPSSPDSSKSEAGEGLKKKSPWIKYVAEYAHKNNMNYFEALKDPQVKQGYHKK